jgi:hypothetical protein
MLEWYLKLGHDHLVQILSTSLLTDNCITWHDALFTEALLYSLLYKSAVSNVSITRAHLTPQQF